MTVTKHSRGWGKVRKLHSDVSCVERQTEAVFATYDMHQGDKKRNRVSRLKQLCCALWAVISNTKTKCACQLTLYITVYTSFRGPTPVSRVPDSILTDVGRINRQPLTSSLDPPSWQSWCQNYAELRHNQSTSGRVSISSPTTNIL